MKTKLFLVAIFFSQIALSQTIYKSSIDNGGATVSLANIGMVYTIGEVNVQEVTAGNISISEGFISSNLFSSPITFNKSFVTGWTWFSVNVLNDDMSLANLLTCATEGDYIKNQSQSATYYDGFGWYGSLEDAGGLDPISLYKIKAVDPCGISYMGMPVDVYSTPIDIVVGWNWIGYLPQHPMLIQPDNDALMSLTLEEGDYIKNQSQSATFYVGFGWYGSLIEMVPTDGYMMRKQSPDILIYPEDPPASASTLKTASAEKVWSGSSIDPHQFEFSGTVTAQVYKEGSLVGSENDLVLAYVDDQLRGAIQGIYFKPTQAYAYPLMVYSNLAEGDIITFRYYDAGNDRLYLCDETLEFTEDMIVANAFEAFDLHVNGTVGLGNRIGSEALSLNVYPNPFSDQLHVEYTLVERSKVRIAVYDMLGRTVDILEECTLNPGLYNKKWNATAYPEGSYILKLSTESTSIMKRIILIR